MTVASSIADTPPYGYLVTAQHVIHDATTVAAQIPNPFADGELYEPVPINNFKQPLEGIDLAIAPTDDLFGDDSRQAYAIPLEKHTLPPHKMPPLGGRIFYIGLFAPSPRMMARSGTIAALEQTGLTPLMATGHRSLVLTDFAVHIVDCRSYGGFSGAPCFLEMPVPSLTNETEMWSRDYAIPSEFPSPLGRMTYLSVLCGMFIAHATDEKDEVRNAEGAVSRYGVGFILPSRLIRDGLMAPMFANERDRMDSERMKKIEQGIVSEGASSVTDVTGEVAGWKSG